MASIDALLAELDRQVVVARRERRAAVLRLIGGASGAGDGLVRGIATQHPWSLLAGAAAGGAVLGGMGIQAPIRTALAALRSGLLLSLGLQRCSLPGENPGANTDPVDQTEGHGPSSAL
jgi:hypothetical protein